MTPFFHGISDRINPCIHWDTRVKMERVLDTKRWKLLHLTA